VKSSGRERQICRTNRRNRLFRHTHLLRSRSRAFRRAVHLNVRQYSVMPISGSCLCGKVAFEVTGPPIRFIYCHCRSCQKSSGSIHAANLAFPLGSLNWTQGKDFTELFVDTNENPGFPRRFCRICGSPVPKVSRSRQVWVVPSGTLDSDPGMRPQASIFWAEHALWYLSADQIVKNDGPLPNQLPDPTPASGTPLAGREPRLPQSGSPQR